mgnify:CR=1 FL=1
MRNGYIIDVVDKILFLNDIHTNRGCVKTRFQLKTAIIL